MSEHSAEADRVDESIVGGADSSIESDIAASGTDGSDVGVGDGAEDGAENSHAADVAAGFEDSDDAPVLPAREEDGTL